jgi:PAS domain S-box-containing protein
MPEPALSEAQQQYEALFNLAADGMVVHELVSETARGQFILANPAICNLLGYTPQEMSALTPLDIMAAEDRHAVGQDTETMARDGVLRHEKTLIAKDGRRIPVEVSTRLFPYQGRPLVMSVIRDITERKAASDALRESEARLRMAQAAGGVGSFDWDLATRTAQTSGRGTARPQCGVDGVQPPDGGPGTTDDRVEAGDQ